MRRLLHSPLLAFVLCATAAAPAWAGVRIEEEAETLGSKVRRWTMLQDARRLQVTRTEGVGVLYHAGVRTGVVAEIGRPDRGLIYQVDPTARTYRVVSADALAESLRRAAAAPANPNDQPLRTLYRSETTAVEVVPTGKKKRIAGLDAEQILARAVVGATNLVSGSRFNFTFDQEVWITRDPRLLQEVSKFEEAYVDGFGTALSLQEAEVVGGQWNDAFINHIRSMNDRVRALGGYPLAQTTTVLEEALAQQKGEKGSSRKLTVAARAVRKVTFEEIPQAEFEPPAGFRNSETGETLVASEPAPMPEPAPPTPAPAAEKRVVSVRVDRGPVAAGPAAASPGSREAAVTGAATSAPGSRSAAEPGDGRLRPAEVVEKPLAAAVSPAPAAPRAATVSAPPTNVVLPGNARGSKGSPGKAAPVAPAPAAGSPALPAPGQVIVLKTAAPPQPVTVDEPLLEGKKRKKGR